MQSSSSLFRKFAKDNVGGVNFRRPEPKDETAKKATEIFRKYSSGFSSSESRKDELSEERSDIKPPVVLQQPPKPTADNKPSFADVYRKKYGSRKQQTTTESSSTEKVTYPPRPATTHAYKYTRFAPTPKPFFPKFKRMKTTTLR